jgi:hypothetical protein
METQRVFKIPAANLPELQARLAGLTKRAAKVAKRGQLTDSTEIGLCVGEKILECSDVPVGHDRVDGANVPIFAPPRVYFLCTVTGTTPKLAGWSFVATLQHEEGGTILRTVPTATLPEGALNRFRNAAPACEHCNYNRRRNDTFVVRHDDGTVKQVGRNCLADFTGVKSPEALAKLAELLAAAGDAAEASESDGFGGGGEIAHDLGAYLEYVATAIRLGGWLSRGKARDEGGKATADTAWEVMNASPRETDRRRGLGEWVAPATRDIELARTALAWTDSHLTEADSNTLGDYEHNLRVAVVGGIVTRRLAGIAASLISYYERAQGKILRAKLAESAKERGNAVGYVGTVGKRENFRATLVAVYDFDSQYGVVHTHKFVDSSGAILVWKTGTDKLDLGEYSLKATIKQHGEFRGELQTVITRASATKLEVVAA